MQGSPPAQQQQWAWLTSVSLHSGAQVLQQAGNSAMIATQRAAFHISCHNSSSPAHLRGTNTAVGSMAPYRSGMLCPCSGCPPNISRAPAGANQGHMLESSEGQLWLGSKCCGQLVSCGLAVPTAGPSFTT